MNIGILGLGALGLAHAGLLIRGNNNVFLFGKASQIEKIKNNGITFQKRNGRVDKVFPTNLFAIDTANPDTLEQFHIDYLIICLRYESLIEAIKQLSLLNVIIDNFVSPMPLWTFEQFKNVFPESNFIIANSGIASSIHNDTITYLMTKTRIGPVDGCDIKYVDQLANCFNASGIKTKISKDLNKAIKIIYALVFTYSISLELSNYDVKTTLKNKSILNKSITASKETVINCQTLFNKHFLLSKVYLIIPSFVVRLFIRTVFFFGGSYLKELASSHVKKITIQNNMLLVELRDLFIENHISCFKLEALLTLKGLSNNEKES